MNRILVSTPGTASVTYSVDGVVVDPGVVTVNITRDDGTALVTAGATAGSGAAARTFNLTAAQLPTPDVLRLDWTSATKGVITTYLEVVGGFLFNTSELRALSALSDTVKYPAVDLAAARTMAESALEDVCGVAFVPRYARVTLDGGADDVLLRPRPRSVTAVSVGGVAIADLTTLGLYRDGRLYNPAGWTAGRLNVVVKYVHGHAYPPPRVGRAALLLAKRYLVDTPVSDRATSLINPDGTTQWMVTAGVRGALFDIPECNAVVDHYGLSFGVS
jgi:hypothetical protein